jgi:hypothetical protein
MLFTKLFIKAVLAITSIASPIANYNDTNTTYIGPENGHLVIVGGNLKSDRIWQRIIDLAGGPNASIVVVPTAGGDPTYNASFPAAVSLQRLGANVTVLHTIQQLPTRTNLLPLFRKQRVSFLAAAGNGD